MVWLMVFYFFIRAFKYRIGRPELPARYAWYLYYVPLILAPTLFLMNAIRIYRGEKRGAWDERLLLIPGAMIPLLTLTNDLHHWAFRPGPDAVPFIGSSGTYTYGPVYYVAYVWMIVTVVIATAILAWVFGKRLRPRHILVPIGFVLLCIAMTTLHSVISGLGVHGLPFQTPEIHIFTMVGICEFCIRSRLIPYNENYSGFFSGLRLPVLIADRRLQPAYASAVPVPATEAERKAALKEPVYISETERLSGKPIRGGYAFWVTDEAEVRRANDRLQEANELLESENTLIEYENRQKEQTAYLESRRRVFHEIAEQIYPTQKRIAELLNAMQPGTPDFKRKLARVSVLNAYVKRKTNLLLLAAETEMIDRGELVKAVAESAHYLSLAGQRCSVNEHAAPVPAPEARALIALYDAFEQIAEQLLDCASMAIVSFPADGITLSADADEGFRPGADVPGAVVQTRRSEGALYISIRTEEGGAGR